MPFLETDHARLAYRCEGAGPAVVLTHGFCGTGATWAGLAAELAPTHTVITWDLRGHGQSDAGQDLAHYSAAASVGDLLALLDACDVGSAALVGHSLGGFLSLAARLAAPERVWALALLGTGPGFRKPEPRQRWNDHAARTADRIAAEGAAADCAGMGCSPEDHRVPNGLVLAARGILPQHDAAVIESLGDIDVPTLIVVGEGDEPFLAGGRYLADHIAGSRLVVVPEAGHAVHLDAPATVNRLVVDFLDASSPAGSSAA